MADTYTLISSVTVGAGGASSIDFTSIPATYTDLLIKVSARGASGASNITGTLRFNSDAGSNYSALRVYGDGTNALSNLFSPTASIYAFYADDPSYTANTFGNAEIYIPNYLSSTQKSVSTDAVQENNATASQAFLTAGKWTGTAAISSISLAIFTGNLAQYSTAYLYGIKNS